MAEFIPVDGPIDSFSNPTWDQMKEFIGGGYLQRITLEDGRAMYMDEDGKFKKFKQNDRGTVLATFAGIAPDDVIVGNVVVITMDEERIQNES